MRSVMSGMLRRNSAVRIGPSSSRHMMVPFQRPSITVSAASIGQSLTPFFDTAITASNRAAKFVSTLFSVSIATRVDGMEEFVAIIALIITGPLVGIELGVAAVVNPLAAKLPDSGFRTVRSGGSKWLGRLMPFWYLASLARTGRRLRLTSTTPSLVIAAVALMVTGGGCLTRARSWSRSTTASRRWTIDTIRHEPQVKHSRRHTIRNSHSPRARVHEPQ